MIYDLQLKKGGELVCMEWEQQENNYVEKQIKTEDIIFYTNGTVCLEKNFTLKDLFLFVKRDINYALSNTFGFGGHNASLLFKKFVG